MFSYVAGVFKAVSATFAGFYFLNQANLGLCLKIQQKLYLTVLVMAFLKLLMAKLMPGQGRTF